MEDWRDKFAALKFRPGDFGGMKGRFEGIDLSIVEHPFKGLSIMGNQFDGRSACEFECFIPVDSSIQDIAKAMVDIYHLVHPEKRPTQPQTPRRPRPSREEALSQVPTIMRQVYSSLSEIGFLFFDHDIQPDGFVRQKIGEVISAYVYDLELTSWHPRFREAATSDGRKVQLIATDAHGSRASVTVAEDFDHLLIVQLWGRELLEIYNGPMSCIWYASKRTLRDGSRVFPLSRLRGHNHHVVPESEKLRRLREWNLDIEGS